MHQDCLTNYLSTFLGNLISYITNIIHIINYIKTKRKKNEKSEKRVKEHQSYYYIISVRWKTVCCVCLWWVKREKTRTNEDKSQLLQSYIKYHVEVHSSTTSRWTKEILKETGLMLMFLVITLPIHHLLQKHVYFRYLCIICKCFQRDNWFKKGYESSPIFRRFKQRMEDWAPVWFRSSSKNAVFDCLRFYEIKFQK